MILNVQHNTHRPCLMCAHDTCTAAAMAFQKTGYGGQESHDSCQVLQGLESSTYKVHATLRGMRKIYQTNINKLSKHEHYNIEIRWELTNIPQISHPKRWLVLLWVSWKELNSCSTGTLLKTFYGNGRKAFLEYSEKEFMQSDHICTFFYSILFITFAHGFLLCFKSDSIGATTANCSTLCKSKHWKAGDANHQWYLQRRWNSTLLFLRVHAVASFRNIWQACSTRIFCKLPPSPQEAAVIALKKESSETTNYHQISTNLQESNWHSMQSSNYCCLSASSTTSYNHIQPILQPGAASRLLHWLTFGPFYFDVTLSV